MPIYDINKNFGFDIVLTPKDTFTTSLTGFTHVRPIPVHFVSQNSSGINTWASRAAINVEIPDSIINTTNTQDIYVGSTFQPDTDTNKTFAEFITDDLTEDMYVADSFSSVIGGAQATFNAKMSVTIFDDALYDKLVASFNIADGVEKTDGFGFIGTRNITSGTAPNEDGTEEKKLAIIFYQATGIPAQTSGGV